MKRLLTTCLLMSVISLAEAEDSSPASAPGTGPGMGQGRGMGSNMPAFEEFDLDKNGYLHKEEFVEARTMRIADRAKDGRMMRGLSNMMEFQDFDNDGDGKVTPDEFAQGIASHRQEHMRQMQQ